MSILTDKIDKRLRSKRHPSGIQHKPSPDGTGKWETNVSIKAYRRKRNARNRTAALSRAANRQVARWR